LAWMQMKFGWLKLGGDSAQFIVDSYPVRVAATDMMIVFLSVVAIGLLSSLYPAIQAGKDA